MITEEHSPSPEFSPLAIGEDFSPLPAYKAAGDTALDFGGLLTEPLKVHEDLKSGCGGQTWPAGMVLAKHLLRYHRDELKNARILEIGAGGGLVGLAVARGCSVETPLYITDQLEMFELMKHNIVLNEVQEKAKAYILNWSVPPLPRRFGKKCRSLATALKSTGLFVVLTCLPRGEPLPKEVQDLKPDVILAADCVYFEPAFPLLLTTLSDLLALNPSATIYFCFKKRRRADMQFLKKAQKAFEVTDLVDDDRPIFSRQGLFLYAIRSRKSAN